MRRLALTVASAAALLSGESLTNHASAMKFTSPASIEAVIDSLRITEDSSTFTVGVTTAGIHTAGTAQAGTGAAMPIGADLVGAGARGSAVGVSDEVRVDAT